MEAFEALLALHRTAIERYILYRIPREADAEDLFQEVCTAGFLKFQQLRDRDQFKPWMLAIARNRCADYFRRSGEPPLSIEEVPEHRLPGIRGKTGFPLVEEALEQLTDRDREILDLCYWQELPQADIARQLGIPVGTVKSRLHTAKEHFKKHYPEKGTIMTKLPKILPSYTITPSQLPPFSVKWEECMGWLIVPKPGQQLHWGMYDHPSRERTEWTECRVTGLTEVHGLRGVEIAAIHHEARNACGTGSLDGVERRFVVQLTDTHCRYLAESHTEDGVRKCFTFLDGEAFLDNWGFGPDNCGTETNQHPRGTIMQEAGGFRTDGKRESMDIVGRYTVVMDGKRYETVCLMDVESYDNAVATMQYLDRHGRTILWRRFNRHDWQGQNWLNRLPDNERVTINGEIYVHWYDCITDYIL